MPIMKSKATGEEFDVPDSERNEALATGKFDEFYLMKSKADGEEFMVPAQELGDALKSNKLELTEVYEQRKNIEENPTPDDREPMSKTKSFLHGLGSSMTMGFDDELIGGIEGGVRTLKDGGNFSDNYESSRDAIRAKKSESETTNPLSHMGGSILGGMAMPFGAGKAASTLAGAVTKGAAVGLASGGIQGLGDNERSDSVIGDVAWGATKGATLGALGGGLGHLAKGITKAGRAELGKEIDAFHAGRDSVTSTGILDEPRRIWAGVKETLNSANAQEDLFKFLQGSKVNTVSRMVEDGSIPKSQEKAMLNMLDKLSDEEYILMKLQEGDPEVSSWIAKQSGGNVAEKQKFLAMKPDDRQALRSMDLTKDAKQLTPIVENARHELKIDTRNKVESHTANARENFNSNMLGVIEAHDSASRNLDNMADLVGPAPRKYVDLAGDLIGSGKGGREDWNLLPDVNFSDVTPEYQFNRLQKAREILDEGIDWDKIKTGARKPTHGEKILIEYRDAIDTTLKSSPGKVEADNAYKTALELKDMIFNKTELKGGVDPYKIRRLLNDTDDANRFRDGLEKLREWSNSANPDAKAAADDFLGKFNALFARKKSSDALNQLQREGGPSALQIQRLDRSMKGDTSVTKHAVKQTADFLLDNEATTTFLQESIGKAYKDMSIPEKTAFTRVYLKLKQQGGIGSSEVIKHNFNHELSKIK